MLNESEIHFATMFNMDKCSIFFMDEDKTKKLNGGLV